MIKYLLAAVLMALAACKTTDPILECSDRVTTWSNEQVAAGRKFVGQGPIANRVYAFAYAVDAATVAVFVLVGIGAPPPPANAGLAKTGVCTHQGESVDVFVGTIKPTPKPPREASL